MVFIKKNQNDEEVEWPMELFEGAPIVLLKLDLAGSITDADGHGLALLNLSAADIIGQTIYQLFQFPGGISQFRELSNRNAPAYRTSINGHGLEIYINNEPGSGSCQALILIEQGVSVHDSVYQELKASEERHRAIWENSPVGICLIDEEGIYRFVNPAYCRIYGFKLDELLGRSSIDLIVPAELRPGALQNIKAMFKRNKAVPLEQMEFINKDGQRIWVQYSADFVRRNGEPQYLVSMNSDITKQRRVEAALEISEKRYQELFDSVMEGLGLVDENEIVRYCNPAFAGIFGESSPRDMIGKSILDYIEEGERTFVLAETARRKKGLYSKYELNIMTPQHALKTLWISVSPRFDDAGKYAGAFGAIIDITKRKQTEIRGQARLKLLEDLRRINNIEECLTCGCQAISRSKLYRRAVITLHNAERQIVNLGQVGLDPAIIEIARKAPAPDKALAAKMMDQRFRISHSYFIPVGEAAGLYKTKRYIPQKNQSPVPESAWQVGDEFFSQIIGSDGRCEGWLSVDTPFSGKRPTLDDAICLEELINIVAKKVNELRSLKLLLRERQVLERKNIALKEVFARIEEEKIAIERKLREDIDSTMMPAYEKLLNQDGTLNRTNYDILGAGLRAVSSSTAGILDLYAKLSPREIEICELLKNGKKSADVARTLKISRATVQKHRELIRRKLDLKNKKINLVSYLKSCETQ